MSTRIRIATSPDIEEIIDVRTSVRENCQSRAELAALGVTPASIAAMLASSSRAWIADVDTAPAAFAMADAGSDAELRANGFYQRLGWSPAGVQPDGQIKYVKRRADSGTPYAD